VTKSGGAFADDVPESTCVDAGVENGVKYATVVVIVWSVNAIPERATSATPSGKPSAGKRTKSDRKALCASALGSTISATVKEGVAVKRSVAEFRILVLRKYLSALTPEEFVTPFCMSRFCYATTDVLD